MITTQNVHPSVQLAIAKPESFLRSALGSWKMRRFSLHAVRYLVLWMLLRCGRELVAAVPPGQSRNRQFSISISFLLYLSRA